MNSLPVASFSKTLSLLLASVLGCLPVLGGARLSAADPKDDHLVFRDVSPNSAYENLWRQKLSITGDEAASFVFLPGNVGEEYSVSLEKTSSDQKAAQSKGYRVTMTRASRRLAEFVSADDHVDPKVDEVKIARCEVPMSAALGQRVYRAWLGMLTKAKKEVDDPGVVYLDSSKELFFATNHNKRLAGRMPMTKVADDSEPAALLILANLLADYCEALPEARQKITDEIDGVSSRLTKE